MSKMSKPMVQKKAYTITKEGLKELQKELKERKGKIKKHLQDQLDSEIGEGDISENSGYYRVQDDIASNNKRIGEIETIIENAEIVDGESKNGSSAGVDIGSSVTLKVNNHEITYEVVGSTEADPKKNKISVDSPFGKALLGKKPGDCAVVKTPIGTQKYDIITVV